VKDSVKKIPLRYAYQKIILNSRGKAKDYVVLSVNHAFEKMIGLNRESILGKRASKIFPGASTDQSDWVDFCGTVALTGVTQETIRYVDFLGDFYKVTAFSPENEYFITVFQDIASGEAEEWRCCRKLTEATGIRNDIAGTFLAILFERSPEAENHAERVMDYCGLLADKLKLSSEEKSELSLLAMLHDVGKVGVRQSILRKSGPLTDEEWKEMRRHPEIGYRIVRHTTDLMEVAGCILAHHEHWDGGGYPLGLAGEKIPLMCRILAVADAFDAMTASRAYREAISVDEAVAELYRNAGTQFDPELARIFGDIAGRYI